MKLLKAETIFDNDTFEPRHRLTVEVSQTFIDDVQLYEGLRTDIAQVIGLRFMELIDQLITANAALSKLNPSVQLGEAQP